MSYINKAFAAAAALVFSALTLTAQATLPPTGGRGGRGPAAPALKSPEVHPDRTITFRFRAPQAPTVELNGEITQGKGPVPMTKGSDGVWTVTIGPLPPEIWIYNFRVSGLDLPDPLNISIMPRSVCCTVANFVEVPGDGPLFYDPRPVPHGEVRMITYESKAMEVPRTMWVYTPPGYDKSTAKYPVYYLLHGNGETQAGWVTSGRANFILDNLIADGKAQPMIVVMPHGHAVQSASTGPLGNVPPAPGAPGMGNFTLFTTELLEQVIPMVEKNFRVIADADHRAIGGLSMGAGQSMAIGLHNLDQFAYIAAFSGGGNRAEWEKADPAMLNEKLKVLWVGCGTEDPGYNGVKGMDELLTKKNVKHVWNQSGGGHSWPNWQVYLSKYAPLLFRD